MSVYCFSVLSAGNSPDVNINFCLSVRVCTMCSVVTTVLLYIGETLTTVTLILLEQLLQIL